MKINIFHMFLFSLIIIVFCSSFGCSVVQEIYLGDVEVGAPVTPPPTHVTIDKESSPVTVSFKLINLPGPKVIHTSTDGHYGQSVKLSDTIEYRAKTNNLDWNIAGNLLGADVDFKIWKSVAFFGGIHFPIGKGSNLLGGNIGIGIHSYDKNPNIRFDLGLGIQKYDFKAITIIRTKGTSFFENIDDIAVYEDRGSTTNLNPFLTMTLNSSDKLSLINYFFTVGYFTQNLLGFYPGETHSSSPFYSQTTFDERSDCTCGFLYLNPGITYAFDQQFNIIVSAKILKEMTKTELGNWLIMPSLQVDIQL